MPFFYDPNLDKEKEEQAAQTQISGAAPVTATASGGQAVNKSVKSGSGFQNLDKYLENNSAKAFGGEVLGKVGSQIQGAGTQMQAAADQFRNQVNSSNQLASGEQIESAIKDPSKANAEEWQKWQKQNYTGPSNLSETAAINNRYWSGANQAKEATRLLGSEGGRFALFDQYFGRPNYSMGQKSIDNLLYQRSGSGGKARDLQNEAIKLGATGASEAQRLQNEASARAGEVEANRKNVRKAIGIDDTGQIVMGDAAGALGKTRAQLQTDLEKANSARNTELQEMEARLRSGAVTEEDRKRLGLNAGERISNIHLDDPRYFEKHGMLNVDQIMTPEQRSYLNALNQLSGVTDTLGSGSAQERTDPYAFKADVLRADVAKNDAEFDRATKETPISYTMPNGQTFTKSAEEIRRDLLNIEADRGRGILSQSSAVYESRVKPAYEALQRKLMDDYGMNRTLSETSNPRMGAGTMRR